MAAAHLRIEVEPDEPLVHVGDRTWTRRQIEDRATEVAGALRAAGAGPGAAVAVRLPDDAELVATLLAAWRVGAVYVPVNPRAPAAETDHVLATVEPAVVVSEEGVEPRRGGRHHDAGVALVSFTSGTTGPPQPVELRHDQVARLMDGVLAKMGFEGRDRSKPPMPNLIPVSLSLWAGIYNVLFAFRVGAPVVLMERFDPVTFAELVRRFEIRSVVLPPAAMAALVGPERVDPGPAGAGAVTDLSPLRYVRSITAPLSPLLARRFHERFGVAVLNSYGQTEVGGEIVGWSAADWRESGETHLGAVGRPHQGIEVRAEGGTGELLVRTPAMDAVPADRLTPDGWFRTGDIGRVDAEGFVWVEGRVSDMVNRGGLKVFPAEVEEVLRLAPEVAEVAVAGVPDDRLGEVPVAFVVGRADPATLESLCREHLAPYKVPARFVAVDDLPRNEVGKVVRRQLPALDPGSGREDAHPGSDPRVQNGTG